MILHYITYITHNTLHYITYIAYITSITYLYITLHYATLHYITLHYIHYTHYITLRYVTLHYITLRYIRYITVSSKSVKQECPARASSKRVLSRVPCKTLLLLDDGASHLHKEKTSIFIFALVSVYSALHKVTAFGFVGSIRFFLGCKNIAFGRGLALCPQAQNLNQTPGAISITRRGISGSELFAPGFWCGLSSPWA